MPTPKGGGRRVGDRERGEGDAAAGKIRWGLDLRLGVQGSLGVLPPRGKEHRRPRVTGENWSGGGAGGGAGAAAGVACSVPPLLSSLPWRYRTASRTAVPRPRSARTLHNINKPVIIIAHALGLRWTLLAFRNPNRPATVYRYVYGYSSTAVSVIQL